MDLNPPGTDGREALSAIKGDDAPGLHPVMMSNSPALPCGEQVMTAVPAPTTARMWRVLVIDDCPGDRAEVCRLLRRGTERRYELAEAKTGAAGVRAVFDALPDCVVLDYNLPDMDAVEVLAALAGPDGLTACPVVVLTGTVGHEHARAVLRAGAQDYLGKGWMTPESLTHAVENAVERWAMAREMCEQLTALRTSEERLRLAIAGSDLGTWHWDLRSGALDWSERCLKIFGIPTRTAMSYEKFLGALHPEDCAHADDAVQHALQNGSEYRIQLRTVWPDGSVHWAVSQGRAYYDAAGVPTRMEGIALDITELRRAEEARDESVRNYRALAVASSEIAYRMSADWSTMLPMDGRQLVASSDQPLADWAWLDMNLPPDEHPRVRQAIGEAIAGKTLFELEHRVFRPDGSLGWTFSRAVPILDGNEAVIAWFGAASDITERKQVEEALRKSEARLRRVFESNVIGMIRWDLDRSLILDANAAFLRLTGFAREDLTNGVLDFRTLTPPEWTDRNEAGIQTLRTDGIASPYEKEYFRKDGSRVPLIIAGTRFEDSPSEGMSFLVDISELKRVEEKLRESESRFTVALKHVRIVVYTTDADLRYTWIHNPHPAFDPAYILGRRDDELFSPEQAAPLIAIKLDVLNRGVGRRAEFAVEINGDLVVYDLTVEPLREETGSVVGVTVAAMDITERKREENAVRISEVRYRRLFESAKDGILILDAHAATITNANPFITELMGYSMEELRGKELWQIGLFQDVESSKGAMRELQEKGYIRYEDLPLETKAGRRINVEFISNVYGQNGETVIQCNIRDISDRKRLEESLRQHAANLAEADLRQTVFLATLAHELRNPLAPIRNGLQIIKLAGANGMVEQARAMMDRQLTQLVRLEDDLLDVSRVTSGKLELRKGRVELRAVIDAAVETSGPAIEQAGHELAVVVPNESIMLDGDAARLAQVLSNLLNNSAKYTHRGGRIRLMAGREGETAVVSVKDNGIGIPPAMLDEVFVMFTQVNRTLEKTTGGLGIGLSLVKGLMEMHGGTVEAKSEGEGMGSEFVVRLPVVTPAVAGPDRPERPDWQTNEVAPPALRRILVVDDNVDAADSLGLLLEMLGNDIRTANDGQAGIDVAAQFLPDVVLMDIGMPKLNGYEAARRIRQHPWGRGMMLVALTGWGQEHDRRKSAEAGFDHHLVKPVELSALTKLISG